MDWMPMIDRLKNVGIAFEAGMTEDELNRAEQYYQFRFPQEIREFLSYGVPVGADFFDYRDCSEQNLKRFCAFQDSIERDFRFDLKHNREDMVGMFGDRFQCSESFDHGVIQYLHESVKVIPFYAHRCFFDGMDNMPIISFWQAVDTIIYGGTFENYLEHEFLDSERLLEPSQDRMKNTGIWYDIIYFYWDME